MSAGRMLTSTSPPSSLGMGMGLMAQRWQKETSWASNLGSVVALFRLSVAELTACWNDASESRRNKVVSTGTISCFEPVTFPRISEAFLQDMTKLESSSRKKPAKACPEMWKRMLFRPIACKQAQKRIELSKQVARRSFRTCCGVRILQDVPSLYGGFA